MHLTTGIGKGSHVIVVDVEITRRIVDEGIAGVEVIPHELTVTSAGEVDKLLVHDAGLAHEER